MSKKIKSNIYQGLVDMKKNDNLKFPIHEEELGRSLLTKYSSPKKNNAENSFLNNDEEGELSIDVYQNEKEIIVKTAIAGVGKKDLEISLNQDMLTIKGNKKLDEKVDEKNYFYQECYWGKFSRSLILPENVDASKTKARLKNGVLTILMPKLNKDSGVIEVKEIE